MADNVIITPGYQQVPVPETPTDTPKQYLEKDKYLTEYEGDERVSIIRDVLNVYPRDMVYTKDDVDTNVSEKIREVLKGYLSLEDVQDIEDLIDSKIINMTKTDGTTPFTQPQSGVDPMSDNDLTTKKFVQKLLSKYVTSENFDSSVSDIQTLIRDNYNQQNKELSKVYKKEEVYSKSESNKTFIRQDGTTPFTKAQTGADPQTDSHLATKRYVDKVLYKHLVDVDPHGFLSILNNRLSQYIKKDNVFDKTQTYSRTQIDSIINKLVNQAIGSSLQEYIDSTNDKFEYIRTQRYVKQDGSVPFRNPQAGVAAVNSDELVTLKQVQDSIDTVKEQLTNKIDTKECEWKTSGPVIGSAGLVEVGAEFANEVSFQEIMDAIFYGKGINIIAPELGYVGSPVDVTVCAQGSLASFEHGELYQNGKLIHTFTKGDFEESNCITVSSEPIKEDTEFIFKAFYINGSFHEVNAFTKLSMPIFIGLLPKWKFGNTVTYDYLMQLYTEDPINNKFYDRGTKLARLDHKYAFSGKELKHIMLAIPANYPELYQLVTPSQQFGLEAFDIIDMIPLQVPGADKDVIYKLYIYREAIVSLNNPVTFNFLTDHE